jgi:hypothetical protein
VSGPPPPAISPPESSRSWWCCRSCLLLAAVRGAQPRGCWRSSAITRLQGFSSCSPAAISRQWSSRGMTTILVVERSEPGCSLPLPSASRMFIIRAGEEGELSWGPAFRMGWRPASSTSIRWRRAFTSLAEEANFGYAGPADCGCRWPPRARFPGLDGLVLTPAVRMGARTSSRVLRQPPPTGAEVAAVIGAEVVAAAGEAARCRGGCLRWRDQQCHLPPSLPTLWL